MLSKYENNQNADYSTNFSVIPRPFHIKQKNIPKFIVFSVSTYKIILHIFSKRCPNMETIFKKQKN